MPGVLYLSFHFTLRTVYEICVADTSVLQIDADPEGWRVRSFVWSHREDMKPVPKLMSDLLSGSHPLPHTASLDIIPGSIIWMS